MDVQGLCWVAGLAGSATLAGWPGWACWARLGWLGWLAVLAGLGWLASLAGVAQEWTGVWPGPILLSGNYPGIIQEFSGTQGLG